MNWQDNPFRYFYEKYAENGRPFSMHVDLTYECPLKCVHCYARGMEKIHPVVMDTRATKDLLEQAADLGVLNVTFSGGEPWLRRDLHELVRYARQLRFLVRLKTSGVMLTSKDVELFRELGLVWVDVSIHGMNAETHDAVTGIAGSHAKAMRAVHMLHKAGIRVQVSASALTINYREIPDLIEYFEDELGITTSVSLGLSPGQVIGEKVFEYQMERGMAMVVADSLIRNKTNYHNVGIEFGLSSELCFAGRASFHVGPDGLVHPCVVWPEIAGDLKQQSLRDIWFDSPVFQRIRTMVNRDRTGCKTCNLFGYCNFCPGRAYQETGSPVLPYESACLEAQWSREAYERKFGFAPDAPPKD